MWPAVRWFGVVAVACCSWQHSRRCSDAAAVAGRDHWHAAAGVVEDPGEHGAGPQRHARPVRLDRRPKLNGNTYEWDIVATADNWRKTHNFRHHTYTNVRGMDDDIGYGLLRIFPEQRWKPFYLLQPIIAPIFALLFQWGVAAQDLRLGRWLKGRISGRAMWLQTARWRARWPARC